MLHRVAEPVKPKTFTSVLAMQDSNEIGELCSANCQVLPVAFDLGMILLCYLSESATDATMFRR